MTPEEENELLRKEIDRLRQPEIDRFVQKYKEIIDPPRSPWWTWLVGIAVVVGVPLLAIVDLRCK